jgi:large subunit ribosomal protein L30
MIAAVRVRGLPDVSQKVSNTLDNLGLRKKHQVVVYEDDPSIEGMMNKAKDYVAYGEISDETVEALEERNGEDVEHGTVVSLRAPKGGFKNTRKNVGQGGTLGKRDDMDDLLQRMV